VRYLAREAAVFLCWILMLLVAVPAAVIWAVVEAPGKRLRRLS